METILKDGKILRDPQVLAFKSQADIEIPSNARMLISLELQIKSILRNTVMPTIRLAKLGVTMFPDLIGLEDGNCINAILLSNPTRNVLAIKAGQNIARYMVPWSVSVHRETLKLLHREIDDPSENA